MWRRLEEKKNRRKLSTLCASKMYYFYIKIE